MGSDTAPFHLDTVADDVASTSTAAAAQPAAKQPPLGFLAALPRKREIARQFTPSWFTVAMGTGSVSITISAFPFTFRGQQEIAWAVWFLTALLFVLFSCALLARAVFFPSTMRLLFGHPNQSLFMGAVPMAFSTLTNGVVAFWVPRYGVAAAHAAHVMFWVNFPAVLLCIVLVPFSMFTTHDQAMHSMTAVWLLPVVPACVAANTAGVVAAALPEASIGVAVALLGMALLGIGFLLSFNICTVYYQRLTCHKLPAREVIISSFLPVGPMGMTAWALLNLSLVGRRHVADYLRVWHVVEEAMTDAEIRLAVNCFVAAACLLSTFLWGYATWWLLLAVGSILETARSGIPFNLGFWGSVFPLGVYAGATCLLAETAHSQSFTYIGAIVVCCHVLLWLVVVSLTAQRAWTGQLFHAPCLSAAPSAQLPAGGCGAARAGGAPVVLSRQASEVEAKLQRLQ